MNLIELIFLYYLFLGVYIFFLFHDEIFISSILYLLHKPDSEFYDDTYEPHHEKTCLWGFDQLRLKPACSATEAS